MSRNDQAPIHYHALPIFNDNYIWVIYNSETQDALAVDPGESTDLLDYIQSKQLHLTTVLITHHHPDHTGGIQNLRAQLADKLRVIGPKNDKIQGITDTVAEGDLITVQNIGQFEVIQTPGHTLDHLCFYSATLASGSGHPWLLCGDTLFSGGCGRLFEGTPKQMYDSLSKLSALPEDTLVFCTHEYTAANLRFAQTVDPDNQAIRAHLEQVNLWREQGQSSLPSNLAREKHINLFLQADSDRIAQIASEYRGQSVQPGPDTFATLRAWKDVS